MAAKGKGKGRGNDGRGRGSSPSRKPDDATRQGSAPAKPERRTDSSGGPQSSRNDIPFHDLRLWQIQPIRDLLFVAALLAIVWLGWVMSIVTVPLLVGLMLAYLFEPIIRSMVKRLKWSRIEAVLGLMLATGVILVLVLSIVVPLVISQSVQMLRTFNDGTVRRQAVRIAEQIPDTLRREFEGLIDLFPLGPVPPLLDPKAEDEPEPSGMPRDRDEWEQGDGGWIDFEINERKWTAPQLLDFEGEAARSDETSGLTEEDVRRIVREMDRSAAARATGGFAFAGGWTMLGRLFSATFYLLLLAFLIPFCFFFFSVWYPSLLEFGKRLLPQKHKDRAIDLIIKMDRVVNGFVRGRIVVSSITIVMLTVGWFVLDVPYAIILGIVTGVLFLVPFLPTLGWLAMLAVSAFIHIGAGKTEGMWWIDALIWPTAYYFFVQVVETYFLTPKIAGKATNLDPVTVVIAVVAGGALGGVYGMLLAIPIAACSKILITEVFFPKIDAWLKGERTDPLPFDRGD